MGSICHFPRALAAGMRGHCSQILVFISICGAHKKGCVAMTPFVLFFPSIWVFWDPRHCQTRENAQNDKSDPALPPPPHSPDSPCLVISQELLASSMSEPHAGNVNDASSYTLPGTMRSGKRRRLEAASSAYIRPGLRPWTWQQTF